MMKIRGSYNYHRDGFVRLTGEQGSGNLMKGVFAEGPRRGEEIEVVLSNCRFPTLKAAHENEAAQAQRAKANGLNKRSSNGMYYHDAA
jgi:hypothetical protein